MGERKAVTNKMAAAYRRGTRPEKSAVLDQLVTLTGWHRDHARAQLRQLGEIRMVTVRTPRTPLYPARVVSASSCAGGWAANRPASAWRPCSASWSRCYAGMANSRSLTTRPGSCAP